MSYIGNVNVGSTTHLVGSTLYGTCNTAAGTKEKAVVCTNFDKLLTGVTIHVKFDNTNSIADPTLNVNSTGAKAIKRYGTTAPSTSVQTSWYAGAVISFTYDGTYWMMDDWTYTADGNTDEKVKQTADDSTASNFEILFSNTADNTTRTEGSKKSSKLLYNPSTGTIQGNRVSASKVFKNIITGTGTAAQDKGSGVSPRYFPAKWTFNTGLTAIDGDIVTIKIPVAGHSYGVYMSIDNGTTYYPIVCNSTGRLTTHYPVNNYITVVFEPTGSAVSIYPVDGGDATTTVTGGVWRVINYYDSNTDIRPSAYCDTAAGTAAKVASCTNYTATANTYLHILMRYANTKNTALTLNVNSQGAKPIYINGAASSASNYTLPAGTYIVWYDGTNYYFKTDGTIPHVGSVGETTECIANGESSHAEGSYATASGNYSHAEGYGTKANASQAHAEGYSTSAIGNNSHAEGSLTYVSGAAAHVEGYLTYATENSSHAEGYLTSATNYRTHAEGYLTLASGLNAHAEGYSTSAFYTNTHTEGSLTYALGASAHAEGNASSANGYASHAEGGSFITEDETTTYYPGGWAWARGSHAEGCCTYTAGICAHAEGIGTCANSEAQHVEGKYNVVNSNMAHIIGGGTSSARKNIFTVDWSGNVTATSYNGITPKMSSSVTKTAGSTSVEISDTSIKTTSTILPFCEPSSGGIPVSISGITVAAGKVTLSFSALAVSTNFKVLILN